MRLEIFTVTMLGSDGDTVPWDRAFLTEEDAIAAVTKEAIGTEDAPDPMYVVFAFEPEAVEGSLSARGFVDDRDSETYDEWLITKATIDTTPV